MTPPSAHVKPSAQRKLGEAMLESRQVKKDDRLTFRIESELKRALEAIAAKEGRSVAQVCEAFLKAGIEEFNKKGPRSVQRFLSRSSHHSDL
jgi:hypothetical protein